MIGEMQMTVILADMYQVRCSPKAELCQCGGHFRGAGWGIPGAQSRQRCQEQVNPMAAMWPC